MDDWMMGATDLRSRLAAALSAVEHAGKRVIIVRNRRVVGALVSERDLGRLQKLPPEEPVLSEHERTWRRREAMERHVTLRQALWRARETLEAALVQKDQLAAAHAQLEVDELTAAMNAALVEATNNL